MAAFSYSVILASEGSEHLDKGNNADQYGNLLDGNNDGPGGTTGDDDWSGTM